MTTIRAALAATTMAVLVMAGTGTAYAATVSATDGASSASITTPVKAPSEGKCVRIPYAYTLDADVDYAAAVILDARSSMVARGPEMAAGTGTGKLSLCGATLHGKASPFTLQLLITYTEASGKGAVTAVSKPFTFQSKSLKCKKTANPGKGTVKAYTTGACPVGWRLVQGS